MQITGNQQMVRIVRHNDESVREGYIRNGGKEVKLITSALKAFQCNNRIVMAQKKHSDDFLRGRIIGRLECERTQLEVSEELGIAQSVISRLWQRFQNDGNVSRCYSTGHSRVTTPNEYRYLAVAAKRNRRNTASGLSRQISSATGTTVSRQTVYRRLGNIDLYARRPVRCVPLQMCSSILTELESNRACVGYAWPTNCSPSNPLPPPVYWNFGGHCLMNSKILKFCERLPPEVAPSPSCPSKDVGGNKELWFQQDAATCHTARATIDLLKDTFGDRLISRFGPVNWPPRSCDLTPLDYFLWGYVKSLVYADKPQTLDHLEDNIRRVIADIRPQMLEKSSKIGLHPSQPWQSYARNHT
ncbi:transposable element Tcb2 transposase [Trichonephila clavipes]|nr:transposable element Tcb2 transposase [Trichonephila clavipes]